MIKLSFEEYSKRKLASARTKRIRKKWSKKLTSLFFDYCIAHYGVSFNTFFYATYEPYIREMAYAENPFVRLQCTRPQLCGSVKRIIIQ